MASYRRPKGVVVRPLPDWNLNNMATFLGGSVEGPAGFAENGVYNDANDGSFLVLWESTVSLVGLDATFATDTFSGFSLYQATAAVPSGDNLPLNPTVGQPFGAGFFNAVPNAWGSEAVFGPQFRGNVTWSWPHDWPMCVVPAGWIFSFQFNNEAADTVEAGVSIMWEVARFT